LEKLSRPITQFLDIILGNFLEGLIAFLFCPEQLSNITFNSPLT
jgi:hypothetical protein